jgi:hypothetical protein
MAIRLVHGIRSGTMLDGALPLVTIWKMAASQRDKPKKT